MSFEATPNYEPEADIHRREREMVFYEFRGGPLKPHDLLTTKLGIDEATPVLHRLKVPHKISLYSPEVPLSEEAVSPAEYRISIFDPNTPDQPARQEYVEAIFAALREAGVPVQKTAPGETEGDQQAGIERPRQAPP
jgi:hypothetical protein